MSVLAMPRVIRRVVVVVLCVVGIGVTALATSLALSRDRGDASPAPASSASSLQDRPTVSVVGESYARSASALNSDAYWATKLAAQLSATVSVSVRHGSWAGSGSSGADGVIAEAGRTASGSDVVVLMASPVYPADQTRLQTVTVATRAFAAAKRLSPDAELVLVGPVVAPIGSTAAELRASLKSAAKIAGARWVDPIAKNWFAAVQADDLRRGELDASEQLRLAERLKVAIAPVIAAR